jgi:transposase
LISARHSTLGRIRELDRQVRAAARRNRTVRLFMTAPGVGPITARNLWLAEHEGRT